MRVSRQKTEYLRAIAHAAAEGEVKLQGTRLQRAEEFKYLGSTAQSDGEAERKLQGKRRQAGQRGGGSQV